MFINTYFDLQSRKTNKKKVFKKKLLAIADYTAAFIFPACYHSDDQIN